jgi:hypothetical protein
MSKKRKAKSVSSTTAPAPLPPSTLGSSLRALWRRNGLFLSIALFIFSNLALRGVDANQVSSTAFPIIGVLTVTSIGLALGYGLEYVLTQRRASLEQWDAARWNRWREGF